MRGKEVQFNHLNITRVDTASGVFIGNNVANGWRSCSKSNHGFGNISGSLVYNTVNMVFDNDTMDTIIYEHSSERTTDCLHPKVNAESQTINFSTLNVNALNINSAINMGENLLSQWRSHGKTNMGIGNVTGVNVIVGNANTIDDQDIVDSLMTDPIELKSDSDNKSPL